MAGPYVVALDVAYASEASVIDVSSHASTLTDAESAAPWIIFTGALAANATFEFATSPARQQIVENATTGAFDLFIRRGPGGVAHFIGPNETLSVR